MPFPPLATMVLYVHRYNLTRHQKIQRIWREEFEEEISADEARLHVAKLDKLYLVRKVMPPKKKPVTLKDLYPGLGPEDLERLDEWYERYAAIILKIFERLEREKSEQPREKK